MLESPPLATRDTNEDPEEESEEESEEALEDEDDDEIMIVEERLIGIVTEEAAATPVKTVSKPVAPKLVPSKSVKASSEYSAEVKKKKEAAVTAVKKKETVTSKTEAELNTITGEIKPQVNMAIKSTASFIPILFSCLSSFSSRAAEADHGLPGAALQDEDQVPAAHHEAERSCQD